MLSTLTSPVIFAHRGASSHAPENTLAAFQLAFEQGAQAIELDVQLTKDQEVVVFHDIYLNRTTDGTGRIKSYSLAELKMFNAGKTFSPVYQNERIPSLAEALKSVPLDKFVNIELKNSRSPFDDLPFRTATVIRDHDAQNRVLISSFSFLALYKFNKEIPSIPLGLLFHSSLRANLFSFFPSLLNKIQSIHLSFNSLTPELVAKYKRAGKLVFSYTLNHTQDILNALDMGIDGFFTDDPGFSIRILSHEGLIKS